MEGFPSAAVNPHQAREAERLHYVKEYVLCLTAHEAGTRTVRRKNQEFPGGGSKSQGISLWWPQKSRNFPVEKEKTGETQEIPL
jgi:hypothetical protein